MTGKQNDDMLQKAADAASRCAAFACGATHAAYERLKGAAFDKDTLAAMRCYFTQIGHCLFAFILLLIYLLFTALEPLNEEKAKRFRIRIHTQMKLLMVEIGKTLYAGSGQTVISGRLKRRMDNSNALGAKRLQQQQQRAVAPHRPDDAIVVEQKTIAAPVAAPVAAPATEASSSSAEASSTDAIYRNINSAISTVASFKVSDIPFMRERAPLDAEDELKNEIMLYETEKED